MRLENSARVLRMELRADVPAQIWYLYNLHETALRVGADTLHAVFLVFVFIAVVELVTMAVTLADLLLTINLSDLAAFAQLAAVSSQAHGAAHVGDIFLVFHHIDDVVRSVGHLT